MSACSVFPNPGPDLLSPSILDTGELPELPCPAPLPQEPIGYEVLRLGKEDDHDGVPLDLGDKRTNEREKAVVRPWKGNSSGLARVCFDCTVTVQAVYGTHDYDRTPICVVPLTKLDVFELVRYRGELARATPKSECVVTEENGGSARPSESNPSYDDHELNVSLPASASPSPPSVSATPPLVLSASSTTPRNPGLSCSTPSPFPNGRLSIPLVAVPPPTLYPISPLHKRPSFVSRHHLPQGQTQGQSPGPGAAIAAG